MAIKMKDENPHQRQRASNPKFIFRHDALGSEGLTLLLGCSSSDSSQPGRAGRGTHRCWDTRTDGSHLSCQTKARNKHWEPFARLSPRHSVPMMITSFLVTHLVVKPGLLLNLLPLPLDTLPKCLPRARLDIFVVLWLLAFSSVH